MPSIRTYLQLSKPVMHVEHKAGDKMYIDFAGSKLRVGQGEAVREVEVFVAILACQNALRYFGRVPKAIST